MFTMVSYGKKKRGKSAVRNTPAAAAHVSGTNTKGLPGTTTSRTITDSPAPSPVPRPSVGQSPVTTWAQATKASMDTTLVTIATFAAFHQQVFPIIEKITREDKHKKSDFIKRWRAATTQQANLVTGTAYFWVISKAFGLENTDLYGYVNFLKTCPDLEKHLCIVPSPSGSHSGFCYKVLSPDMTGIKGSAGTETLKETKESVDATDDVEVLTIDDTTLATGKVANHDTETIITEPSTTTFRTCYNNDADFQEMLQMFWPSIQQYVMENANHQHAKQWLTWMTQGLSIDSDLVFVKRLLGCDSFDQLFLFFRDSLAINSTFELQWDHKINYRPSVGPKAFMVTPAWNNKEKQSFNSPESFHNTFQIIWKTLISRFYTQKSSTLSIIGFELLPRLTRTNMSNGINGCGKVLSPPIPSLMYKGSWQLTAFRITWM